MGDLYKVGISFFPFRKYSISLAVFSATRGYASRALPLAGVHVPSTFVTADDVSIGKPDPAPYLKGAAGLGLSASDCKLFHYVPNTHASARARY